VAVRLKTCHINHTIFIIKKLCNGIRNKDTEFFLDGVSNNVTTFLRGEATDPNILSLLFPIKPASPFYDVESNRKKK